jgi:hypothetical protein
MTPENLAVDGAFCAQRLFQIMFAGHFKKFVRVDASFHDSIVPHNRHTMQNDP